MGSFWEYANPKRFTQIVDRVLPAVSVLAATALVAGLAWGFFFTPDDYRQGSTVKIIYLHVPSALLAINAWLMMLVASLVWLVRRHHVSALAARAAAPVGAVMTVIALLTGAIWGQPMWGTWWAWDPRLTSFLILFLFYLGYIALWSAVENDDTAADLGALHRGVGLRDPVALCGQLLEPGAAPGRVALHGQGGKRGRRLLLPAPGLHRGFRAAVPCAGSAADPDGDPGAADAGAAGAGGDGMMPDLGKYAATVLSAYGGALALLVALVAASLWRSARVARALREVEERVRHGRD